MCGICGKLSFSGQPIEKDLLEVMCRKIRHRGPDDSGIYITHEHKTDMSPVKAGLGHTRLSIIDISTGRQPIHNEDKSIWLVFNGEIYNFHDIKENLLSKGHRFYTNTDSEVIVHLYEEHGKNFVKYLNGMFGIAIWDERDQSLILARDRIGIKPLYYYQDRSRFLFASEIKSLLIDTIHKEIDIQALHNYFSYNYIPSPNTIFKGIKKLLPGHILINKNGKTGIERYWDIEFSAPKAIEDDYIDKLYEKLKQSVRYQLISDVPVGVFLSGGLDSSAIVGLASEVSSNKISTFSIGFEDKSYNELKYARIIAKRFNTDHHELVIKPDIAGSIDKILSFFDEPFADSSVIPVYYLSKLAGEHVKTVLGGDGGDEVFAGYETYKAFKLSSIYKKLPDLLKKEFIPFLIEKLPVSHKKVSFDYKAKQFIKGAMLPPDMAHYWWKLIFTEDMKRELYLNVADNNLRDPCYVLKDYFNRCSNGSPLNKILYTDTKLYLPDDILVKVDRMSMAHSLEVRVPLLDHKLVEFAASIPANLKLRGLKKKYLLKKTMSKILPAEIINGKKRGFNVPIADWLNNDLKDFLNDTLSPSRIKKQGLFNSHFISRMIEDHQCMKTDCSRNLWGLLAFAIWHDNYM